MRKYENVDIVAALGAVVELNTEHYKGDFKYDVEKFKKAALHPDGDNNRLLWMSRQSGTWCFPERDIYVKDAEAFNTWNGYATILGDIKSYMSSVIVQDRILAYAVDIKGIENGRIKGDLYELDYRDTVRQITRTALPVHSVSVKYEDGTELQMPHSEYHAKSQQLYHQHGTIISYRADPEDTGALRDIVKQAREQREKEARPATFKLHVQNPKPPSIKQQIAAGKKQLEGKRAAAPARTAAKNKNAGLED